MKYLKNWNPILLFILLIPLLASQCEKENEMIPELPPITTEGKNTFGCRVNGEIWLPEAPWDLMGGGALNPYYNIHVGGLNIAATKEISDTDIYQSISLSGNDIWDTGEFNYNHAKYLDFDISFCSDYRFDLDTTLGDKLKIIHLDTENRIISGTFEFTAINEDCDPVVITDGRFDVQY
ncbi:MAG: hypothetical protein DWQ02_13655 [Bacteroidetes bacterium]|nr:MAG: hypothetical protein DWQ02_13655 [Bacteroidota bacterium]